ncbi:STAS domain-containing protein [Pseudonocardia sp. RS010]|uniref:STAS domain-containing protein n=1 Tax=Pseudonocardia sp. RS010 TaxID=3385979 RepID=UPI0039A0191E
METRERSWPGGLRATVTRPDGTVLVLRLEGEIDLATRPVLDELMQQVAADPAIEHVIVDLTGVRFLAACGVRWLHRLRMQPAARRMQVVVSPGPGSLRRVLALVDGFEIVDSSTEVHA